MKTLTLALSIVFTITSGAALAEQHGHDVSPHQMQTTNNVTRIQGMGALKAINAKAGKVQIAHEAIPALNWPPMIMWFVLRAPLPNGIKVGDSVHFELVQSEKKQWEIVMLMKM
ncbi:MAG: copper-binding protein [Gallionellaceae bacterium]|nr:copper-binding protein [Gallionellaceae bacterium]